MYVDGSDSFGQGCSGFTFLWNKRESFPIKSNLLKLAFRHLVITRTTFWNRPFQSSGALIAVDWSLLGKREDNSVALFCQIVALTRVPTHLLTRKFWTLQLILEIFF